MAYKPFEKYFWEEHEDIKAMTPQAVNDLRKTLGIKVSEEVYCRTVKPQAPFT